MNDPIDLIILAAPGMGENDQFAEETQREDLHTEHEPQRPEDDDLVNVAIIMALASRSEVRVLPREQIPGKEDLAALLRF